jgi:hypothetical protein
LTFVFKDYIMVLKVAHQPIFAAKQKEGLSRGSKQTFFLLLCRKDGFTSRHRYPKHFAEIFTRTSLCALISFSI